MQIKIVAALSIYFCLTPLVIAKNLKSPIRASPAVKNLCQQKTINTLVSKALDSKTLHELPTVFKNKPNSLRPPVGQSLDILREIEAANFGRPLFSIENDLPGLSGATFNNEAKSITLSRRSYDSVVKAMPNSKSGISFLIAHELGHFIQSLSPTDDLSSFSEEEQYNIRHAQTDCIALNLLDRSHIKYDLFSVTQNLNLIMDECKEVRSVSFCTRADELRKYGVHSYINKSKH